MRETGKPTFVVSDYYWRARLRARGSARSRGSRVVSTHGLNTQRMSAVQKVWLSYVYATILLQHGGPTADDFPAQADNYDQNWYSRSKLLAGASTCTSKFCAAIVSFLSCTCKKTWMRPVSAHEFDVST
jgi:hypothetical protein